MSGYSERLWRKGELTSYLQKPFTPVMLLTQVRSLLDIGELGANRQYLSRMNFLPPRLE